jgi:hypothetical protein
MQRLAWDTTDVSRLQAEVIRAREAAVDAEAARAAAVHVVAACAQEAAAILTPLTWSVRQASTKLIFPFSTKASTKHHPSIGLFALKYLLLLLIVHLSYRSLMKHSCTKNTLTNPLCLPL